ncbi:MAG: hypothetical protein A3J63_04225 [Candidatus Moranbacteria bacterium RIFCSPHIGHO2_02_FULL_40_12b]|nr:MAG: hypothetical protein A3J63_04225 [Candidatus Moranbacteria bacterium RIFCSPHIGHO2_02_FULL_40_12b]OGI23158.1 MAG: hypothetical protein A3E91_03065 [Candidatus Moranbacteria bacterium RIFCSPHIGHO2_12_FULL_40_10]
MKITIVGSSVFAKQMVEYRDKLITLGHKNNLHEHYVAQGMGEMKDMIEWMKKEHANVKIENDYIKYHYNEIVEGDAILVLNYDKNGIKNYIGGNTLMELGFAHVHDKKIFLLNPIPEMPYSEEIKAVQPVILNGDLSKII